MKKQAQTGAFSDLKAKQKPGTKGCEIVYGENLKNKEKYLKFIEEQIVCPQIGVNKPSVKLGAQNC